jgi:hypothetical protein
VRAGKRFGLAALVVLFIAGTLFGRPAHPHFLWDRIPGFYALFGFASSGLLVLLKGLGKRWLQRPGSYYDA